MSQIRNLKIRNINIDIADDLSGKFELKTECRVKIRTPNNENDNSMMLLMEMKIYIPDSEQLRILANASMIYEFDEKIDSYEKMAENEGVVIGQKQLFARLNEVLTNMGYEKLDITEE